MVSLFKSKKKGNAAEGGGRVVEAEKESKKLMNLLLVWLESQSWKFTEIPE